MKYALVDSLRHKAFPGGIGNCPTCGAAMIAKCGPRIMHHWAHADRRNCDLWWENETPWHREWKALFPDDCQEISHIADNGEIHRADIKTPTGIVIEVQHSSMTDAERESREAFYSNLVWILDGGPFRQNFDIYHILPDPNSELAKDLVWFKAKRQLMGARAGLFLRLSEGLLDDPNATKANLNSGWIHGIHEIKEQVEQEYRGHHQYDWVRPRNTWLDATCPVFVDFGGDFLAKLETYDESELNCIRLVSKQKFVLDVMTKDNSFDIAS